MFLKLPLNQKNTETKELTTDFLMKLDAKLSSDKFKETVLGGKKTMKYTYQPIVRTHVCEDGMPNPDKHTYMKMKLLTEFPTNFWYLSEVFKSPQAGTLVKSPNQSLAVLLPAINIVLPWT